MKDLVGVEDRQQLGLRIRAPFDDFLNGAVSSVRRLLPRSERVTKTELIEVALLSLIDMDETTLARRVREFRHQTSWAPEEG
jgi:hypothetical protein